MCISGEKRRISDTVQKAAEKDPIATREEEEGGKSQFGRTRSGGGTVKMMRRKCSAGSY